MNKLRKKQLVDRLMDAYVGWREACLQVSDAYACWTRETGTRATSAFGSYISALDREEQAAEVYAALARRTSELVSSENDPSVEFGGPTWRAGSR
jgi:hypothetical protein